MNLTNVGSRRDRNIITYCFTSKVRPVTTFLKNAAMSIYGSRRGYSDFHLKKNKVGRDNYGTIC